MKPQCAHAAEHAYMQSKLDECRQHSATAIAANRACASARHSAEIREQCALVAGAASSAEIAAHSAATVANALARTVADPEPTVAYRIAFDRVLCQAHNKTPEELLSESSAEGECSAFETELGKRCEVKAVGSYFLGSERATLDSSYEAVIIVANTGPTLLSESEVKKAVKNLVKKTIQKGARGANGQSLGNPRVRKVAMASNAPEQSHATEGPLGCQGFGHWP